MAELQAIERATAAAVATLVREGDNRVPARGEVCLVERERGQWCRAQVMKLLKSMFQGMVAE